jgi:hypothetical protein
MGDFRGLRPITVPVTAAGQTAQLTVESCRLTGWSLAPKDVAGFSNTGAAVAPIANQSLFSIVAVPAGLYTASWTVTLVGPAAAADQNNFALFVGGLQVAVSDNPGAAGQYPQPPIQIVVPAGGAIISVRSVGAGTATVTYDATLALGGGPPAECVILDGGQIVGVSSMAAGAVNTQSLPAEGVYVGSGLAVQVNAGTISGCLYVRDSSEPT